MRIQLKQNEIEAALKSYLANQGISVSNKEVTMDFTAGRKNKGISVEVVIEDSVLVGNNPEQVTVDEVQTDLGSADPEYSEPQEEEPPVVETKPSVGSLFGS